MKKLSDVLSCVILMLLMAGAGYGLATATTRIDAWFNQDLIVARASDPATPRLTIMRAPPAEDARG